VAYCCRGLHLCIWSSFKPWGGYYDGHDAEAIVAALLLSGANTNAKDSHVKFPPKVATQAWSSVVQPCLYTKYLGRALVNLSFALHACTLLLGNKSKQALLCSRAGHLCTWLQSQHTTGIMLRCSSLCSSTVPLVPSMHRMPRYLSTP